jgi:hypothetical protein
MGGKRPDQYRIDRDEGRTSDHKRLPNRPGEGELEDTFYSEVMESALQAEQPIPPDVLEPETEHRRELEMEREEQLHQD